MVSFLLARLNEPSTWRGVLALLTSLGIALNPEQQAAIITAGLGLIGAVGVFTSDPKKK